MIIEDTVDYCNMEITVEPDYEEAHKRMTPSLKLTMYTWHVYCKMSIHILCSDKYYLKYYLKFLKINLFFWCHTKKNTCNDGRAIVGMELKTIGVADYLSLWI